MNSTGLGWDLRFCIYNRLLVMPELLLCHLDLGLQELLIRLSTWGIGSPYAQMPWF